MTAILIAACGGGGGGGDAPASTVATGDLTGTSGCTIPKAAASCLATIKGTLKDASDPRTFVGTTNVSTATSVDTTATVGLGDTVIELRDGNSVLARKVLTVGCETGSTWDGNVCKEDALASYWPPATINAPGVKVEGANQLPVGCTSVSQQCWKDAVASGLVKFVATSATAVGVNSRPIVFAYFRNTTSMFGVDGLWNVLQLYADDGSLFGADISGGTDGAIEMVYGNTEGAIYRVGSICRQIYWNGTNWTDESAPCPI